MRGIKITFGASGPKFDFGRNVVDFDATVQNTMVNLGTTLGSDPLYPDRGTSMMLGATRGQMINPLWAGHLANFAALRTLAFMTATDVQSNPSKLQSLRLRCVGFADQRVRFAVQCTSASGAIRGDNVIL